MIVYVATNNAGKFRELQTIFADFGWQLERDPAYADVAEGQTSYAQNAALKARALFERRAADGRRGAVIGDDSGLEVAALDGRPGVLSARYGGAAASWAERRAALLAELASMPGRSRAARFVCALHYIDVAGRSFAVERTLPGTIAENERGAGGFSYDPLFVYEPLGSTFGELAEAEKNGISHRARAARALVDVVAGGGDAPEILTHGGNVASSGT